MAARKIKGTKDSPWPQITKDRMRATMLLNRLADHAVGKVEMSATQVRAADNALSYLRPKMAAVEHSGETTTSYVVRMPEPVKDMAQWTTDNTQQEQQVIEDKPLTQH